MRGAQVRGCTSQEVLETLAVTVQRRVRSNFETMIIHASTVAPFYSLFSISVAVRRLVGFV